MCPRSLSVSHDPDHGHVSQIALYHMTKIIVMCPRSLLYHMTHITLMCPRSLSVSHDPDQSCVPDRTRLLPRSLSCVPHLFRIICPKSLSCVPDHYLHHMPQITDMCPRPLSVLCPYTVCLYYMPQITNCIMSHMACT